jgi:prepilin-type N-terminal cleavage/methylation domain-containing protein
MRWHDRRGVTLVELMAVLVVLGILFAVVGVGLTASDPPAAGEYERRLRAGRSAAITTGADVTVWGLDSTTLVRFRPDGQALGEGVDPLNGATIDADGK